MKALSNKGVTLVELLAVIIIMGIIAAIAVPSVFTVINNSKANAAVETANGVKDAANNYFVLNQDKEEVTIEALIAQNYLDNEKVWQDNKAVTITYDGNNITSVGDLTINGFTIVYANGEFKRG